MQYIDFMRQKIHELFGIDLRSLAAFRISLGFVLALDQLWRLRDLYAHYTDFGVLPRRALSQAWWTWYGTLHQWSGSGSYQATLLWISVVLALALAAGYRTRLATFLSWFFLVSLHTRNPYILQGSDLLLRVLLFWSIFLPLEARWSIDSFRGKTPWQAVRPTYVISSASAALLIQVCLVYWCSGFLKSYADWEIHGTAVRDALLTDCWTSDLGRYMLSYPETLKFLTRGTYWLEVIGPTLAFSPVFTSPIRILVVFSFFCFHIPGLGTAMLLGAFPYVSALSWLVFLPGSFWDFVEWRLPNRREEIRKSDETTENLTESHAGQYLESPGISPLPLGDVDEVSDARSCAPDSAAKGTYKGSSEEPFHAGVDTGGGLNSEQSESSVPIRSSGPVNVALGVLLVYLIICNLQIFHFSLLKQLPYRFWSLSYALRMDQRWNMFAPSPAKRDGWFVIVGTTVDGWEVDLFRGGEAVNWKKPDRVSDYIPSYRWRAFFTHIWRQDGKARLPDYARYLCRWWNSWHHGSNRLVRVEINYMCEEIFDGKQDRPPKRYLLYEHECETNPWDFGEEELPEVLTAPNLPVIPDNT